MHHTQPPAPEFASIGDYTWHDRTACRNTDPDLADRLFFPNPSDFEEIREAKEICSWCPVRRICLDNALETDARHGIRGGLTREERLPLHIGLRYRRDRARVEAALGGRNVHLSAAEREDLAHMALEKHLTADEFAAILRVTLKYAKQLLRDARKDRRRAVEAPVDAALVQTALDGTPTEFKNKSDRLAYLDAAYAAQVPYTEVARILGKSLTHAADLLSEAEQRAADRAYAKLHERLNPAPPTTTVSVPENGASQDPRNLKAAA
ncbi:WhiB family transcriptional regulator [Streptomyces phyllanthi]|uniref:Transcriptional regulator WhiB n=1 Tax=Streptomyces phyllanthi TaxID=1803180 RepID=A0A5N8VWT7_9ACTN|nr:WhiB family transcriptional regulator [Streptomyces phyllanthi]MPY38518.1 WhiB family transcriptional regulator [Streptomyces phyllanthi]